MMTAPMYLYVIVNAWDEGLNAEMNRRIRACLVLRFEQPVSRIPVL